MAFLFLLWLVAAAAFDAIYRKSFNWMAIFGLCAGTVANLIGSPLGVSTVDGLIGTILFFSVFLLAYKYKVMSAGDVKFGAALGAWIGWELFLPVWALSCGFAVVHGVFFRSYIGSFFSLPVKVSDEGNPAKKRFIPYVTYLSTATVVILLLKK